MDIRAVRANVVVDADIPTTLHTVSGRRYSFYFHFVKRRLSYPSSPLKDKKTAI